MGVGPIIKNVSSSMIIADVIRRFHIRNSDWMTYSMESIGHALEIIGYNCSYVTKPIDVYISNYKAKIPCEVHRIEVIMQDGIKLVPLDAISTIKGSSTKSVIPDMWKNNWYTLNPNYIHTGFEEGIIQVYAKTIPVDDDGMPLVPDTPAIREALAWAVFKDILSRGYKHPVFSYGDAEERWEIHYPRAKNSLKAHNIEQAENFKKMWTAFVMDVGWSDNLRNIYRDVTFSDFLNASPRSVSSSGTDNS